MTRRQLEIGNSLKQKIESLENYSKAIESIIFKSESLRRERQFDMAVKPFGWTKL